MGILIVAQEMEESRHNKKSDQIKYRMLRETERESQRSRLNKAFRAHGLHVVRRYSRVNDNIFVNL